MKTYKALIKNVRTKEMMIIEADCQNKKSFIKEIRQNGYSVNPTRVKEVLIFDFIVNRTNATREDWSEKSIKVKQFIENIKHSNPA